MQYYYTDQKSALKAVLTEITIICVISWTSTGLQSLSQCADIEEMWSLFKDRIMDGVVQYVPTISKFYDWRKPAWKCPLSADTIDL